MSRARRVAEALEGLEEMIAETGAEVSRGPLPTVPGGAPQLVTLFRHLVANAPSIAERFRRGRGPGSGLRPPANCHVVKPVGAEELAKIVKASPTFWLSVVSLPPG